MRVYTRIVWDIETGRVLESSLLDYSDHLPVAKCDRAQQQEGRQAEQQTKQTIGTAGANAGQISGNLVPRLEQEAVNPTGYGAFGLGDMKTEALQTGGAASGAANERMRLNAIRTGNAAGLGAGEAASAEGGARASGSALQSILAKNAELKAQQQQQANVQLGNILGENLRAETTAEGILPQDINATVNAGKSGWLQNTEGALDTLSGMGGDAAKAYKLLG